MPEERRGAGGWDEVLEAEPYLVAPGGEWRSELYRVAVDQFTRAADLLGLEAEVRARLLEPRRALVVNFPVRRDDGEVRELHGLPRAAHADDGADEGRHALLARRLARRVRGAGDVDDVQVRAARAAVRRREGRGALRPQPPVRRTSWSA